MSSEWKTYQLAELTTFKYGKFLAKSQLSESGFPVFSGYGVVGYLPTYQFDASQLLIVCRGEGGTGDVKMSPPKCSITNLSIVLSPNEDVVLKKFLYWALKASDTHRLRTGSAQAQIVIGSLEKFGLVIPTDISEQNEIAGALDSLDDRITLLRETNATLEAIAQALFKSWFVDFDPVRAKMEGRAPAGMDEATAALFPDALEESELGWVPKGWRVGTLADVASLNAQSLSPRNPPPEINYIDLAGVKANVFDVPQCYSFADAPSRARRVLQEGDCIVGTVRPGNRSFGFIATAQNHLIGSTGFAVLSPKQHWMTAFTYLCATRDESIDRLASLADGGAYPAVRPDVVASTPCTLPPDEVMKVFDGAARPLLDAIGANSEQAQTLSTLRDTLLPRLISGQLRLPEALAEMPMEAA
ncbi:restriction endonuclease subunit S [Acidovorax sp.]|uniref:restriction endonuclease subunit S n=1 Tax=Acidovorax sp. TaxID=1872122 RepID=UPI0027B889A9|nr:restriction endonuclease subunit S [Acidovorax sp.]